MTVNGYGPKVNFFLKVDCHCIIQNEVVFDKERLSRGCFGELRLRMVVVVVEIEQSW